MKHPDWWIHCKYISTNIHSHTHTHTQILLFTIYIALQPVSALKVGHHQTIIKEREDVCRNQSPSNIRNLSKVLCVIVDINMYLLQHKH